MAAELRVVSDITPLTDAEITAGVMDLDDEIERLQAKRTIPMAYLFETIGKPMLERGQRTMRRDGFVYHVKPPRTKAYCRCHMTLLYQCPDGVEGYSEAGIVAKLDATPDFYITRISEEEA